MRKDGVFMLYKEFVEIYEEAIKKKKSYHESMRNALDENLIRLVQREWDVIDESELKRHKTLIKYL